MPKLIFWNTYRLGGSSASEKKYIIEGALAQMFHDHNADGCVLCEVTGDVQLGDAPVGKGLYKASRRQNQLAYSAFDDDLQNHALEQADIDDFRTVFGGAPYKKGGSIFSKQSKRPVAYWGSGGGAHVYVYHNNASAKAAFLAAWAAESLRQDHADAFLLVGDLNCLPGDFDTAIQYCTGDGTYHTKFQRASGGATHNAKSGVTRTLDWAIAGTAVGAVTVTPVDYGPAVQSMGFQGDPRSDHLPIIVAW